MEEKEKGGSLLQLCQEVVGGRDGRKKRLQIGPW